MAGPAPRGAPLEHRSQLGSWSSTAVPSSEGRWEPQPCSACRPSSARAATTPRRPPAAPAPRPAPCPSGSTRPRAPVPPTSGSRAWPTPTPRRPVPRSRSTPSTTTRSRRASTPTSRARPTTSSPGSPATAWRSSPRTGLISDVSSVWPIEGMSDAFKKSSTAPDGKQYFVPISYYPWAVFYRKSVFEKNGWAVADVDGRDDRAHEGHAGQEAHPDRLRRQGRLGADGHLRHPQHAAQRLRLPHGLCQGKEKWDSAEVKNVFTTWKDTLLRTSRRTRSAAPGRRPPPRWPRVRPACTCSAPSSWTASRRRPRPTSTSSPSPPSTRPSATTPSTRRSTGSARPRPATTRSRPRRTSSGWALPRPPMPGTTPRPRRSSRRTPVRARRRTATSRRSPSSSSSKAKSIAQFLDRDTNADLANTVITASLQDFLKNPNDIDRITASIQQQAASILG